VDTRAALTRSRCSDVSIAEHQNAAKSPSFAKQEILNWQVRSFCTVIYPPLSIRELALKIAGIVNLRSRTGLIQERTEDRVMQDVGDAEERYYGLS
jgi:hypothetical protein